MEKTCENCKWFRSYREAYYGDMLEPDDQGWCWQNEPNNKGKFHEHVFASDSCNDWECDK